METSEVKINIDIEGTEKVVVSMKRVSDEAGNMSEKITTSSRHMKEETEKSMVDIGRSYIQLGSQAARLGGNVVQLTDLVDKFGKGQVDAAKFTFLFATNIMEAVSNVFHMIKAVKDLSLATHILTVIEWAHNLAIATKVALLTLGVGLVAAAAAVWWYMGQLQTMTVPMPGLQHGGLVMKPTYALIAEREPEVVIPLSKITSTTHASHVTININEPYFRSRGDMDYLCDRLKRLGLA